MGKVPSLVSVVLPAYNEKGNIVPLIDQIHAALAGIPHEIIVVDDNSPDGTYQTVLGLGYPFVKAVRRTFDPSLAKSIRAGLELSQGDVCVVMDSDFNHQPQYIPILISNIQFYDVVTASRFVYGGAMDTRWRHLMSWVFNIFVRLMTGKYITDSLYGFWAAHRSVLDKITYDKVFWGYGDYGIRLMYYFQELNLNILQIPAVNGRRLHGQSNARFFQVFLQYAQATFHLVWRERLKMFK